MSEYRRKKPKMEYFGKSVRTDAETDIKKLISYLKEKNEKIETFEIEKEHEGGQFDFWNRR